MMEATANLYRITNTLTFQASRLVACWSEDRGNVGTDVVTLLNHQSNARAFCDLDPAGFFPVHGVAIEDNVARFPQCRLWGEPGRELVTLLSHKPAYARRKFIETLLDVAEHACHTSELIILTSRSSSSHYRAPRKCQAVFGQQALQKQWRSYGLEAVSYQQTPSLSTYLLWAAEQRGIPGVLLRVEIPFYLASIGDPAATRAALQLLSERLQIDLDLDELARETETQHGALDRSRAEDAAMDEIFRNLESGVPIGDEERVKLAAAVSQTLGACG